MLSRPLNAPIRAWSQPGSVAQPRKFLYESGVGPLGVAVDGIAELWFEDQAALDLFSASPATRRLREDGTLFIGRQISFTTEEKVIIPREG